MFGKNLLYWCLHWESSLWAVFPISWRVEEAEPPWVEWRTPPSAPQCSPWSPRPSGWRWWGRWPGSWWRLPRVDPIWTSSPDERRTGRLDWSSWYQDWDWSEGFHWGRECERYLLTVQYLQSAYRLQSTALATMRKPQQRELSGYHGKLQGEDFLLSCGVPYVLPYYEVTSPS